MGVKFGERKRSVLSIGSEVKTTERHYTESVMQEAILHSLKGSATNLVQLLGQNATVKIILQKLETVCGTVTSFNTLMSIF